MKTALTRRTDMQLGHLPMPPQRPVAGVGEEVREDAEGAAAQEAQEDEAGMSTLPRARLISPKLG